MKTINKITTFAVTNGPEGKQIVFQYSVIGENGKIIESGKRDMIILMEEAELEAVNKLSSFIQNYIDSGNVNSAEIGGY